MISSPNYKSIEINITTYKYIAKNMTEDEFDRHYKTNQNRYICSICLNQKPSKDDHKNNESNNRKSKSCPICPKCYDHVNNCVDQSPHKGNESNDGHKTSKGLLDGKGKHGKIIQTSQPDITQGMSLLNEVLTVFQSRKHTDNSKYKSKTIILKDASVSTEENKKDVPKLTLSKIFYCSIEENSRTQVNKCVIIHCQPEATKTSQFSMDLINRKSSSIPQMKLEELKKSLKDKTKSKDAVEEVNRMFASVRKYEVANNLEIPNRPMIRNGPRVLPVVKTTNVEKDTKSKSPVNCGNCQTNYKLCSGDSYECCQTNERCENCIYMMCHYQHRLNPGTACPNCHNQCEQNKQQTNIPV